MKILAITMLRYGADTPEAIVLSQASDLSSFGFFQRAGIKEMCTFFSKTIVKRTPAGQRQTVQHEDYNVHVYVRHDGLAATITADMEYPMRVAFVLLMNMMDQFSEQIQWQAETREEAIVFAPMQQAIVDYQDPAKADKITKIQRDLDDTTNVLHKTIESVLERGVKLDDLVDRSDSLSRQSKMFYKQAKKTNSCCVVM
ncbi:soluble NSF attachment protein receptor [Tribonema minus]|uniref:Soluble NSF attachment protein receptor n=1 Tax=Tribonema minus TaxID=303371 RepID=A0A836CN50_9STRA|nr:soluble NSF attachment protein receptor [Tribonema minus]